MKPIKFLKKIGWVLALTSAFMCISQQKAISAPIGHSETLTIQEAEELFNLGYRVRASRFCGLSEYDAAGIRLNKEEIKRKLPARLWPVADNKVKQGEESAAVNIAKMDKEDCSRGVPLFKKESAKGYQLLGEANPISNALSPEIRKGSTPPPGPADIAFAYGQAIEWGHVCRVSDHEMQGLTGAYVMLKQKATTALQAEIDSSFLRGIAQIKNRQLKLTATQCVKIVSDIKSLNSKAQALVALPNH